MSRSEVNSTNWTEQKIWAWDTRKPYLINDLKMELLYSVFYEFIKWNDLKLIIALWEIESVTQ